MPQNDLATLRETINTIDDQILDLFVQRMQAASGVAKYKQAHGLPILNAACCFNNDGHVFFYFFAFWVKIVDFTHFFEPYSNYFSQPKTSQSSLAKDADKTA